MDLVSADGIKVTSNADCLDKPGKPPRIQHPMGVELLLQRSHDVQRLRRSAPNVETSLPRRRRGQDGRVFADGKKVVPDAWQPFGSGLVWRRGQASVDET